MYEDRTQNNYDPEIHNAYLIHDTPFPCHIIYSQLIRLKDNNFLL